MERWWLAQYFFNRGIDEERSWRTGGKSSGKTCWGILFITCWKICDLCSQFSLAWSLVHRRLRVPPSLGQQLLHSPCQSPSVAPTATHLFTGGLRRQETRDCKGIKILLAVCLSSHKSEDILTYWRSSGIWDWATWDFCWACFWCPSFQHAGLLGTSTVLGFPFFFFLINYFIWRLITLQYCSGFAYIDMDQSWVYMCPPSWTLIPLPSHTIPQGHPSAPALRVLSHA